MSSPPLGAPAPARTWLAPLIIALMSVLAYLPAFSAGFIWDDPDYVVNNPNLRDLPGLFRTWTSPASSPQFYPLVFTTFWAEYQLFGLWAPAYHTTNILLHALAAVLLHRVLGKLEFPPAAALFGALLWSLHPVHVESVAWITERKNTLSLVFYLLAFLQLTRRTTPGLVLAFLFFALALASKTVTASLPAAWLLYVYWSNGRISFKSDVLPVLPFFALGLAAGLFTAHLERTHVVASGPEWAFSFVDRCLIAGRAVVFYLHTLVFPFNLAFIYPRWTIDSAQPWQYLFPLAAAGGLVTLFFLRHRIGRGPFVVAAFYIGTLLPALGFFNVYPHRYSFVADHFQHLASLAPLAAAGLLLARLPRAVPVVLLAALTVLTLLQSRIYKDPLTLWTDTLAKNPAGWMVHINLGLAHHELLQRATSPAQRTVHEQKRFDFMMSARALAPHLPETHWNAGLAFERRNQLPQARDAFQSALAADPTFVRAMTSLGQLDLAAGDLPAARALFERAISLQPNFNLAHASLAQVALQQGDLETAVKHFAAAVQLDPARVEWRLALARALRQSAENHPDPERALRLSSAAGHFNDAIPLLPPGLPAARIRLELAETLLRSGDIASARLILAAAVREDPALADLAQQLLPP